VVCPSVDPFVQVLNPAIEVGLVVLPCQPIHTRRGAPLERKECRPENCWTEMVEERGGPFLLPVLCSVPYALQRL
jgi:hypothetical protein